MPINPTGLSICKLQPVNTDPRRNKWACPHACTSGEEGEGGREGGGGYYNTSAGIRALPRISFARESDRAIPLSQHKGGTSERRLTILRNGRPRFVSPSPFPPPHAPFNDRSRGAQSNTRVVVKEKKKKKRNDRIRVIYRVSQNARTFPIMTDTLGYFKKTVLYIASIIYIFVLEFSP